MTVASGTLLVVSIASFNIIWGYPWLGVFAASMALFGVGRLASTLMRPKLAYHLSLPRSVAVGFPLAASLKCINRGKFPAINFLVSFDRRTSRKRSRIRRGKASMDDNFQASDPQPIHLLEPTKTKRLHASIQFNHRGTQDLPDILTRSFFPFYLFQVTQHHPLNLEIVVTPRPLDESNDDAAKGFLKSLGEWSHKLLAGDALDYTGSREYETGMPVRRWDYSSWARLGKPIVREYQSPSIQQVHLIIDSSAKESSTASLLETSPDFERLLSAAARVILDLSKQRVLLKLCLTSDQERDEQDGGLLELDTESMLIHLANASLTEPNTANDQIERSIEIAHQAPTLILSNRNLAAYPHRLPRAAKWIQVNSPESGTNEINL